MKILRTWLLIAATLMAAAPVARAQSATGTISGHVVDGQGLAVPGVTVTAASPNQQGLRSAVTSGNGDYIFPLLPPGIYTVTFELSGFGTVTEQRDVAATQPVALDVTLKPASISEIITVTGRSDTFVNTVQAATNFKAETLARVDGSLNSQNVMETVAGVSRQLGARGTIRADVTIGRSTTSTRRS